MFASGGSARPGRAVSRQPPFDTFNLGDHVGDDPAAVAANRKRLGTAIGLGADRVVWMNQVHSDHVEVVDGPRAHPARRHRRIGHAHTDDWRWRW